MAILNHFATKNYREFTQVTAEIDRSKNLTFSSIDDCKQKGFSSAACKTGDGRAKNWASALGVSLSYESMGECQKRHGNTCAEDTTTTTTYNTINNVMVPITTTDTTYTPGIIGWQAAISDFKKAVPLYASTKPNRAYRADGAYVPFR